MDGDLYSAGAVRRKIGMQGSHSPSMIESSRKEVANGFVDQARAPPSRRLPAGIGQSACGDANSHVVRNAVIVQKEMGNGSAAAADSDGGRVGGVGGKGDVGAAAAGNALSYRLDVYGVGAGKEGRKRDLRVGREVGLVNVPFRLPTIRRRIVAGSS